MRVKRDFGKRFMSILLSIAIVISMLPSVVLGVTAAADDYVSRSADPSTMDDWRELFSMDNPSTAGAGGVWQDKSVFTDASAFAGTGITADAEDSFLVALSTIASNMNITGMSNIPTDTMLVLDVSGSMNTNNNDVAEDLVDAANESIAALLATNQYNRVGVVLYSGPTTTGGLTSANDAILILPLNRYTTGNDGKYLNYTQTSGYYNSSEKVSLDPDVVVEGTMTAPSSSEKEVLGATYIQKGIILAMNQFTAESNSVVVQDPVLGEISRKPILVLMSDGAPTVGSTSFTNPSTIELGDGTSTSGAIGFVSQLSAAYAKAQIEEKYGADSSLFYTLGLGVSNNSIALSVLDPDHQNASTAVNDFWTAYNAVSVNEKITVQSGNRWNTAKTVTKIDTALEQNYVDQYFAVDGISGNLSDELKQAFADIVGKIQLQSTYYPTLIAGNEELSGYVSFVDKIGRYMQVTDIKGIMIHNHLFSGADLASNFIAGGGALGTNQNPTELGAELVASVRTRLGIDNDDTARTLITLAYENGQLSYTDANTYSNYIGWYANAKGEFLGFYQEGVTELPEATGNVKTDPAFTVKSYGYLGEVDEAHGVSKSDMMYATVQVRESITTGEQLVTFAVPAALIPVVTYNVTLDKNQELSDLTISGADKPIRLIYEVALREEINPYNVMELVDDEYLAEATNKNVDGSINFYTNKWDRSNTTGYGTINTYSYFNPSKQNNMYYYQEDAPIYTDTNGTLYNGEAQPSGNMYHAYMVYKKSGSLQTEMVYRKISAESLATAQRNDDGTWYVPKGNVFADLGGYNIDKTDNTTNTLEDSYVPFVDTTGHSVDDAGYKFYVGATLGNNGKITIVPETGIKLTKTMEDGATTPTETFTFTLTNTTNTADNMSYPAWLVRANGTEVETTVQFSNGTASVQLNPKDVLYIGGMTAGTVMKITENETVDYVVKSTSGISETGTVSIVANKLTPVEFVNADRGTGNLTIAKEVTHDFGTEYQVPDNKSFTMNVTLSGVGTKNATFKMKQTNSSLTQITTDENGQFSVTLKHEEQITLFDLPTGTVAKVTERNPGTGFTVQYWDNGAISDGVVTVAKDSTVSVIVVNDYNADPVYPINIKLGGTKYVRDEEGNLVNNWNDDYKFTITLERYGENGWEAVDTKMVDKDHQTFSFDMSGEVYAKPGIYSYQIYEVEPDVAAPDRVDGMNYDAVWHTFSVYVEDVDMDGKLEITRVHSEHANKDFELVDGTYNIIADFTNVQTVTVPALTTIDVQKVLNNASGSTAVSLADYEFGLWMDSDCTILAEAGNIEGVYQIDRVVTDNIGEGWIDIQFDQVGTYEFYVKELQGNISGMSYSQQVIKVVVEVTNHPTVSGALVASADYYNLDGSSYALNADGEIVFTNTYQPTAAELRIDFVSKQITGRDMAAREFEFEVRDLDGNTLLTGSNAVSGNESIVSFNDSLKFNKVGTYFYDIVETSVDQKGVTTDKTTYRIAVTVSDYNGVLTARYVLVNAAGDDVVFKNSYLAKSVDHTIRGNKTLRGRVLLNDEFIFVMTEVSYNGTAVTTPTSWNAKNQTDGSFQFPTIRYDKEGTYVYLVSEQIPDGGKAYGITYDATRYYVTVKVEDNGEGSFVVVSETYTLTNQTPANAISFVNTYVPDKTSAQFTGDKQLTGKVNNTLVGGEYEFELYASDASWNKGALVETVANGANGLIEFTSIDFETEGDQYFIITEKNGGQTIEGVTYDDSVYRVLVEVKDNLRGQLQATVHIYDGEGVPKEFLRFVNTYEVTGNDSVTLSGTKRINGRDLATEDEFTFELYETDEHFTVNTTAKATANVNTATGKYEFNLSYIATDVGKTYYYVIREKDAGQTKNGVTNSTAEYQISVKVEDNDKGGVKTTVMIANATASTLDFVNEYQPDKVSKVLEGTKELTGKELVDGAYRFELYESDANWTQGALLQTKANENGRFTFDAIDFTTADDKYYLVVETNAGQTIQGVTYDDTVYRIFVDVTDDLQGNLQADVQITDEDGNAVEDMTFINKYQITGTDSVELSGIKKMDGRDITADDIFTFEVYESDENFKNIGSTPKATTNTEAMTGNFSLGITYTGKDAGKTFYYVVKEKGAGQTVDGITYSSQEYHVIVKVTDNGIGGIEARATLADGITGVSGLNFTNTYQAAATKATFEGNKTLEGSRRLKANDFTFDLYRTTENFVIDGVALQSVQNDQNGNFSFEEVEFVTAGTYRFLVKENSQNPIGGVTYDTSQYHITVQVVDNGKGQLKVSETKIQKVNGESVQDVTGIAFTNQYKATDATVSLRGEKTLNGRELSEGEFKFLLYATNSDFVVAEDAQEMVALNQEDGTFTFDACTFNEAKNYYFVIREDDTVSAERVTFDDAVYYVTIEVRDDENGKLIASEPMITKAGSTDAVDQIVFENTYTPKPADITVGIQIEKTVVNKGSEAIGPEEFEFILENLVENSDRWTVKTDEDGKAVFVLNFDEDDIGKVYNYKLTEVNDGKENVQYSSKEYIFSITITLSDDNQLVATITENDQVVPEIVAEFENVYDYTPDVPEPEPEPEQPQTGDSTNIGLWIALMFISGGEFIKVAFCDRKRRIKK